MPDLMNTRAAAEYLGISPTTLEIWRSKKDSEYQPRFIRMGRRVLYDKTDLDLFIAKNSNVPRANP